VNVQFEGDLEGNVQRQVHTRLVHKLLLCLATCFGAPGSSDLEDVLCDVPSGGIAVGPVSFDHHTPLNRDGRCVLVERMEGD